MEVKSEIVFLDLVVLSVNFQYAKSGEMKQIFIFYFDFLKAHAWNTNMLCSWQRYVMVLDRTVDWIQCQLCLE